MTNEPRAMSQFSYDDKRKILYEEMLVHHISYIFPGFNGQLDNSQLSPATISTLRLQNFRNLSPVIAAIEKTSRKRGSGFEHCLMYLTRNCLSSIFL